MVYFVDVARKEEKEPEGKAWYTLLKLAKLKAFSGTSATRIIGKMIFKDELRLTIRSGVRSLHMVCVRNRGQKIRGRTNIGKDFSPLPKKRKCDLHDIFSRTVNRHFIQIKIGVLGWILVFDVECGVPPQVSL